MERLSDKAIEIINDLHTERLDYTSEYLPLIEAAQKLAAYEDTGLTPEGIIELKGSWRAACKFYGINHASSISNAPLTLEELREMDGEPVWCEKFEWRICYGVSDFRGCLCMETGAGSCIQLNDYGKTWLAYRRKPEEETP